MILNHAHLINPQAILQIIIIIIIIIIIYPVDQHASNAEYVTKIIAFYLGYLK